MHHKNIKEKIALGLIVATLITNPLTNQYLIRFIDWALISSTSYTVWVTVVTAVFLIGMILWNMWKTRETVNIPKKTAKTKSQKYIQT